jgi:small-conductance mechanosensitive channel
MAWPDSLIAQAQPLLIRLGLASMAVTVVIIATRLLLGAERRALRRARAHASAKLLLDRLIQFGGLVVGVLWVPSIFGIQLTLLVTVVGMAGLAVSLALQDVLKNLVAGLYLLVERPFTIGDRVQFRTYQGVVENVQLRTTALRTATGERVVVPNAMIFAEAVVNRTAYGGRLVSLRVVIPVPDRLGTGQVSPAADWVLPGESGLSTLGPISLGGVSLGGDEGSERKRAEEVLRIVHETGGYVSFPAPRVLVESLTRRMITLRAEVWAEDARTASSRLAWAVRKCLPVATVIVLQPQ